MRRIIYIGILLFISCNSNTISPPAIQTRESKKRAEISKTYNRIVKRTFVTGNGLGGGEINFYESSGYSRFFSCDICRSVTRKGKYECFENYVVLSDTFCSIAAGTEITNSAEIDSVFKKIEVEDCELSIDTLYIWNINDSIYLNEIPQISRNEGYDQSLLWRVHIPYRFK